MGQARSVLDAETEPSTATEQAASVRETQDGTAAHEAPPIEEKLREEVVANPIPNEERKEEGFVATRIRAMFEALIESHPDSEAGTWWVFLICL